MARYVYTQVPTIVSLHLNPCYKQDVITDTSPPLHPPTLVFLKPRVFSFIRADQGTNKYYAPAPRPHFLSVCVYCICIALKRAWLRPPPHPLHTA